MKNSELPAFPESKHVERKDSYGRPIDGEYVIKSFGGLSKLEYFAGMAMQGLLCNPHIGGNGQSAAYVAEEAVCHANALIKELEKVD